jgi:hypothetical protein
VKNLFSCMNSPGRHIVVLLLLVCLSLVCLALHLDKAGEMILVGALATLWPLMNNRKNGGGSN